MSAKIEKIIVRQKEKINEGNFYEAHQQLRVIATRYVKAANWSLAIDILFGGALALLQAGQGGSGGDLCLYLIDVYNKAEIGPDSINKDQIFTLLRTFPCQEPTRKRFLGDAIVWSSKFGEFQNGDPDLHHTAGLLYSEEAEPYEAERHFTLGTRDSPEALAKLEYDWYRQNEPHSAASYVARCVFPYLLIRNLRSANKAYIVFVSKLRATRPDIAVQDVTSSTADIRVHPSLPLLNLLGLLLIACQRGSSDLFRQLRSHYKLHIKELESWDSTLDQIGEIWFGIATPRQGNPLLDMMGNMLFGNNNNTGASSRNPSSVSRSRQANATAQSTTELD